MYKNKEGAFELRYLDEISFSGGDLVAEIDNVFSNVGTLTKEWSYRAARIKFFGCRIFNSNRIIEFNNFIVQIHGNFSDYPDKSSIPDFDICTNQMQFHMDDLTNWICGNAPHQELKYLDTSGKETEKYGDAEFFKVPIFKGSKQEYKFRYNKENITLFICINAIKYQIDYNEKFESGPQIQFGFILQSEQGHNGDFFIDIIEKLRMLFALLAGQKSRVTSITRKIYKNSNEYYFDFIKNDPPLKVSQENISFGKIKDKFNDILQKWFDIYNDYQLIMKGLFDYGVLKTLQGIKLPTDCYEKFGNNAYHDDFHVADRVKSSLQKFEPSFRDTFLKMVRCFETYGNIKNEGRKTSKDIKKSLDDCPMDVFKNMFCGKHPRTLSIDGLRVMEGGIYTYDPGNVSGLYRAVKKEIQKHLNHIIYPRATAPGKEADEQIFRDPAKSIEDLETGHHYKEEILESNGDSEDACKEALKDVLMNIRNHYIHPYKNGERKKPPSEEDLENKYDELMKFEEKVAKIQKGNNEAKELYSKYNKKLKEAEVECLFKYVIENPIALAVLADLVRQTLVILLLQELDVFENTTGNPA